MAKKGMKRPGYTGPEAQNQSTAPPPRAPPARNPRTSATPARASERPGPGKQKGRHGQRRICLSAKKVLFSCENSTFFGGDG